MALPQFSKAGVTTVVFSRGDVYPTRKPVQARQRIGKAHSGAVHTATLSPPEYVHLLTFTGLPTADYDNLLAFILDDAVNFAESNFDYTSVAGTVYDVRYMDGALDFEETSPGQWAGTITLREEIV